jgi:hypothetical protein
MSALKTHYGLKSDIAPCPLSANNGSRELPKEKPPEGGSQFKPDDDQAAINADFDFRR